MKIAVIILLFAICLPSLLVLSEYNHTLRRVLFYTAWNVADVYERIKPTELYRGLYQKIFLFIFRINCSYWGRIISQNASFLSIIFPNKANV